MSQDFSNRVVLVTGGSRGIGRAISVALGRAGAKVAINYVQDNAAANSTLAEVEGCRWQWWCLSGRRCERASCPRNGKTY